MKMIHKHLKHNINYDGSQIEASWALREFGIKGPNIITWIGPMNIHKDKVIDYEDLELEIRSDQMAHFMVEQFDCQPANLRTCYHRQRILVMILKDELQKGDIYCSRDGDDLYINSAKLSVSIATVTLNSMKIHLGINLNNLGTPEDIKTAGIMEENPMITLKEVIRLQENVSLAYIREIDSIEQDISKTRVL